MNLLYLMRTELNNGLLIFAQHFHTDNQLVFIWLWLSFYKNSLSAFLSYTTDRYPITFQRQLTSQFQ